MNQKKMTVRDYVELFNRTGKLSKRGAIMLHRYLWNAYADYIKNNGYVSKKTFFETDPLLKKIDKKRIDGKYCFCCWYCFSKCYNCPIKWSRRTCINRGGEYDKFKNQFYKKYKYARIIANLPKHHVGKQWMEKY